MHDRPQGRPPSGGLLFYAKFENSLNALKIPNEVYIYPGVKHAFANPSGMNYAPEETKDAWAKTTAFLKKYLKP